MIFLKSLLFLPANVLIAILPVILIRRILFYPRTRKYIFGRHLPLTPGIIVKYHGILLEKLNNFVKGFLRDIESDYEGNPINRWENQSFEKCYKWAETRIQMKYVPRKIVIGVRVMAAEIGREFVRQFARSFIPFLMEYFQVSHYLDLINHYVTLEILQKYYDRYIFKYSLLIMGGIALIIGIVNQLIYLIIGG
ncbi:MAG: hypothetical protein K9N06_13490 [Candidatus Cloacimonetes bacterium]|nr:hypothetical protein [Candidatus Cloacimonadota bacterium]